MRRSPARRRSGRLILWHSTEDIEFLECDRVLVFSRGRIIREFQREEISEQAIVDASFAEMIGGQGRTGRRGRRPRNRRAAPPWRSGLRPS